MSRQPNNFNGNEHYALMLRLVIKRISTIFLNTYFSWSSGQWNDGSVDGSNNPNWQRKVTGCIRKCSGLVSEAVSLDFYKTYHQT